MTKRRSPTPAEISQRKAEIRAEHEAAGVVTHPDQKPRPPRVKRPIVCYANSRFAFRFHIRESGYDETGKLRNPVRILHCDRQHRRDADIPLIRAIQSADWCSECREEALRIRRKQEMEVMA